jgi:hypothetical protein
MKRCKRCLQVYTDIQNEKMTEENIAIKLGDLFQRGTGHDKENDLCPQCREELGMLNLMGFKRP